MGRSARLAGLRGPLSGPRPRLRAPAGVAGLGPGTQLGGPRSLLRARTARGAGAGCATTLLPGTRRPGAGSAGQESEVGVESQRGRETSVRPAPTRSSREDGATRAPCRPPP